MCLKGKVTKALNCGLNLSHVTPVPSLTFWELAHSAPGEE